MIKNALPLKLRVHRLAKNDPQKSTLLIRYYAMERFLERLSLSPHQDQLILTGGFLISSLAGIDARPTIDIDFSVKGGELRISNILKMIEEIISITLEDNVTFEIFDATVLQDNRICVQLITRLETMRTPLILSLSAEDLFLPVERAYRHKLIFEERSIKLQAYKFSAILAKKLELILCRNALEQKMQSFYDIYLLVQNCPDALERDEILHVLLSTSQKFNSPAAIVGAKKTIQKLSSAKTSKTQWTNYQKNHPYADSITWAQILDAVQVLYQRIYE